MKVICFSQHFKSGKLITNCRHNIDRSSPVCEKEPLHRQSASQILSTLPCLTWNIIIIIIIRPFHSRSGIFIWFICKINTPAAARLPPVGVLYLFSTSATAADRLQCSQRTEQNANYKDNEVLSLIQSQPLLINESSTSATALSQLWTFAFHLKPHRVHTTG